MTDDFDTLRLAFGVFAEFARVTLELANERKSQIICAGVAGYPVVGNLLGSHVIWSFSGVFDQGRLATSK